MLPSKNISMKKLSKEEIAFVIRDAKHSRSAKAEKILQAVHSMKVGDALRFELDEYDMRTRFSTFIRNSRGKLTFKVYERKTYYVVLRID